MSLQFISGIQQMGDGMMIEVGRNREYKATKGGIGTIIIDLTPPTHVSTVNEVLINVEVGSSDEDGVKVMGTDFIEIPISFKP